MAGDDDSDSAPEPPDPPSGDSVTDGNGGGADAAADAAEQAELERLRARVSELEVQTGAAPEPPRAHHRVRFTAAVIMVIVGTLLVPVSILGVWIHNQVTDTDKYVETMAPLVRDPAIQTAATTRIVNALFTNVDIESEVRSVLPDRAQVLAGPITSGMRDLATTIVTRVIESDRFAQLWDDANRLAHAQMVDVLTSEKAPRGAVVIDLSGVAKVATERLTEAGVPFVDRFADSNRKIEFEVFQSDEVAKVQGAFNLFDKVATILPWFTILLLAASVLVFPNRRRGLVWAASGLALGAALVLITLIIGRAIYLGALPSGVSQPAAEAVFDTLIRFARQGARMVVAVGLVLLIIALVMGPSGPARRLRTSVGRLTGRIGDEAGEHGVDLGPVGSFAARNLNALRILVAVVAGIVLIAWGQPTAGNVLWIAIVSLLVLAVIEVVARAGAVGAGVSGSDPPTPTEPPATGEPPVTAAPT
ncbi:MAG: hypothetical protein ACHQDC_00155 [Acidimicrobiales bacterium]